MLKPLRKINISKVILTILPIITIIPVFIQCVNGLHIGGINTLINFILSAFQPSLDKNVIESSWIGLQITLCFAIISWVISITVGLVLAIFSSNSLNEIIGVPEIITNIIRRILTLPRATHELIWGLLFLQIFGLAPWIAIVAIVIPHSALIARVISDQIDKLDLKSLISLKYITPSKMQVLITALLPKLIPILATYGSYRLECAIRGATLLGIFGLGGIGTEMQLSILSLKFNEMWTSIWILFFAIYLFEKALKYLQNPRFYFQNIGIFSLIYLLFLVIALATSIFWLNVVGINLFAALNIHLFNISNSTNMLIAITSLPWFKLIFETILLMLLASGIAIGLPPILLMIFQARYSGKILSIFWIFCRLIPPPLTTILLLLCTNPSISVGALALGIQNMGVLGRLLKQNIDNQNTSYFDVIKSTGTNSQLAWLYGKMSHQSNSYLSYSLYRTDVILRETIAVGAVGGVGLGWQLRESLSSFAMEEVLLITATFISISLIGEMVSEKLQKRLLKKQGYDEVQI